MHSNRAWAVPYQCWLYTFLSVAPRVLHLLNHVRAIIDVQPQGRRDVLLQTLELGCVLPFWLVPLFTRDAWASGGAFIAAAVLEIAFIVIEPARMLYRYLERLGHISTTLESIPIDIGYTERRWQRLLMIALAMLPGFVPNLDGFRLTKAYEFVTVRPDPDQCPQRPVHSLLRARITPLHLMRVQVRVPFMLVSCSLAYLTKLFYFDVVDDYTTMRSRGQPGGISQPSGTTHVHALSFQGDDKSRWRATLWIATHVMLVTSLCALGVALNNLLEPWDGSPMRDLHSVLSTRLRIVLPITLNLLLLALMHALHKGVGHGVRRIGRRKRLWARVCSAVLVACLPLLVYFQQGLEISEEDGYCLNWSVPIQEDSSDDARPAWDRFPEVGSRTMFLTLLMTILLGQLSLELYGRGYVDADDVIHRRLILNLPQSIRGLGSRAGESAAAPPSTRGGGASCRSRVSGGVQLAEVAKPPSPSNAMAADI